MGMKGRSSAMKHALCLLCCMLLLLPVRPAQAGSLPDQGLDFIQCAGIAADSVVLMGDTLVVTLTDGGTASLLIQGDFDAIDLRWRFTDAPDAVIACYLDHALSMLLQLEQRGTDAALALADSGLQALTEVGAQGLAVLQEQLRSVEESSLTDLRLRLCELLQASLADAVPTLQP